MSDFESVKSTFRFGALSYAGIAAIFLISGLNDVPFKALFLVMIVIGVFCSVFYVRKNNPLYRLDPNARKLAIKKYKWGAWTLIPFMCFIFVVIYILGTFLPGLTTQRLLLIVAAIVTFGMSLSSLFYTFWMTRKSGSEVFD